MAKSPGNIANDIHTRMQREGKQILTMPWPQFYEEAEIKRFTRGRGDDIWESCKAIGIVFGEGNNVVTFCYDANFAS